MSLKKSIWKGAYTGTAAVIVVGVIAPISLSHHANRLEETLFQKYNIPTLEMQLETLSESLDGQSNIESAHVNQQLQKAYHSAKATSEYASIEQMRQARNEFEDMGWTGVKIITLMGLLGFANIRATNILQQKEQAVCRLYKTLDRMDESEEIPPLTDLELLPHSLINYK